MVGRPVMSVVVAEDTMERERKERKTESDRNREEADFLAYFGPEFLLPHAINSAFIYRW
jgi:hypothetical protein